MRNKRLTHAGWLVAALLLLALLLLLAQGAAGALGAEAGGLVIRLEPGPAITIICEGAILRAETLDDLTAIIQCQGVTYGQ